jgi:hypothetical protein
MSQWAMGSKLKRVIEKLTERAGHRWLRVKEA